MLSTSATRASVLIATWDGGMGRFSSFSALRLDAWAWDQVLL